MSCWWYPLAYACSFKCLLLHYAFSFFNSVQYTSDSFSAQPECVLFSLSGFRRRVYDFVHYWSQSHTYCTRVCVLLIFVCSCLIYYVTDSYCLGQIWASLDSCPVLSSHIPDVCTCVSLFTAFLITARVRDA